METMASSQPGHEPPRSAAEDFPYRLLFEHANDAVFISDLSDRILDANRAACRLYGYEREELLAMRINDLQAPERRAPAGTAIREEIDRYRGHTFETTDISKDGRRMRVEVTTTLIQTARGELALSIARDISDRKQIELALRDSREQLRRLNVELEQRVDQRTEELETARAELESVLEASPVVIYAADPSPAMPTRYVSPNLVAIFGYPASRMIEDSGYLRGRVHPEDRAAMPGAFADLNRHGRAEVEYRFLDGAGRYRWVHDQMRLIRRADGSPIEIAGVLTDITPQVQARQQLHLIQSAVEHVREIVVLLDARASPRDLRIVYVNPAFTAVTGVLPRDAVGQPLAALCPSDQDDGLAEEFRVLIESAPSDQAEHTGESTCRDKDGRPLAVEWTISPVRDHAQRVSHWVLVLRDITRRRKEEELTRAHLEELAHVTRLSTMGEMASGLAHELNQLLAAITNFGQGILRRIESGTADATDLGPAVQRVVDQAHRAAEIIRRLRDFVTKRGRHRGPADLNHLVREMLTLTQAEAREKHVRLVTDLAEGLPPLVVDAIQIEQVILNLIRNGIEALAGQHPPLAGVLTLRTAYDQSSVLLEVIDNGPGLPPQHRDRVFDPFFTTKDGGMGMGLTISQSIIEDHGGRLFAAAATTGATFCMALPVARPEAHSDFAASS